MKPWMAVVAVGLWAIANAAWAAPFLVSDVWATTAEQPSSCVYQEGSAPAVEESVAANADGSVYCQFDLARITRTAHSYQVWSKNAWGESSKVPFGFSAAAPKGPTGLRVSP